MVKVNLDACSGCKRCMLACSFYRTGGFNTRFSSIKIYTDLGHRPVAFSFDACTDCKEHYCVEFCILRTLEVYS